MAQFIGKFAGKPTNITPYWDLVKRIITESDVILQIVDARMVELSRNEEVEKIINEMKRPVIYVVNKSDLVEKNALHSQVAGLERDGKKVVFVSNKNKMSYKILLFEIRKMFKENGKAKLPTETGTSEGYQYRMPIADIVVGVLGYPNVGKSSIINGLAHKKKMKVSKKAGTTHGMHWIRISDDIKIIDSPGVIPLTKNDDVRYGLIGARDNETLSRPDVVANAVIKLFMKSNKKAFERFYDVSIGEDEKDDFEIIIEKIGNRKRYLLKRNRIDENRVYTDIVRNWQQGSLRF